MFCSDLETEPGECSMRNSLLNAPASFIIKETAFDIKSVICNIDELLRYYFRNNARDNFNLWNWVIQDCSEIVT